MIEFKFLERPPFLFALIKSAGMFNVYDLSYFSIIMSIIVHNTFKLACILCSVLITLTVCFGFVCFHLLLGLQSHLT